MPVTTALQKHAPKMQTGRWCVCCRPDADSAARSRASQALSNSFSPLCFGSTIASHFFSHLSCLQSIPICLRYRFTNFVLDPLSTYIFNVDLVAHKPQFGSLLGAQSAQQKQRNPCFFLCVSRGHRAALLLPLPLHRGTALPTNIDHGLLQALREVDSQRRYIKVVNLVWVVS